MNALKAATILQMLISPNGCDLPPVHPMLLTAIEEDPTCKSRLFLAAILSPYIEISYTDHKEKQHPLVDLLRKPDLNDERFKVPSERASIGKLLREKAAHNVHTGSHWTSSLLFSLTQELVSFCDNLEQGLKSDEARAYNKDV
ncbi:hypothetical protein MPER_03354 [Moniliophthora perniciosa FA553]|nr:hypothetical protein MPER_03354 [Moniliophthora perniciosa FA553]